MATRVELRKVSVTGPNPARIDAPIALKVVLEVFEKLPEHPVDVAFTWSPVWDFPVDQELDEFEVGPFTSLGVHEFALESDAPDFTRIPDPTGPTALIVTLSYQGRQFLHIGYNVVVRCDGEIPDVFTSADPLTRSLERCFPRQSAIEWDKVPEPAPLAAGNSGDSDDEPASDEDEDDADSASNDGELTGIGVAAEEAAPPAKKERVED